MNNGVPVNYNGAVVGYILDGGKTIQFIDSAAEGRINTLLGQNKIIGVSARALGELLDDNTVEKTEEISYDIITTDKLELNISSEFSGWIASLLKRGLMEYQTSRWDVPEEVVSFVKEFYKHEQSR